MTLKIDTQDEKKIKAFKNGKQTNRPRMSVKRILCKLGRRKKKPKSIKKYQMLKIKRFKPIYD